MKEKTTYSASETIEFGRSIGKELQPGTVIALKGELAAGKTTFVKGLALGLEIEEIVTSPTFTIISEYYGRLPLYHMDLYRISDFDEFELTGGGEMLSGDGVCVIEWSERITEYLDSDTITIEIRVEDDEKRKILIEGDWN